MTGQNALKMKKGIHIADLKDININSGKKIKNKIVENLKKIVENLN